MTTRDAPSAGDVAAEPGRAERKATAWLVRSLALLRVAQLTPGALTVATSSDHYRAAALMACLFIVEVAWCAALFAAALRRGWFTKAAMLTDAGFQAVVTVAVGWLCIDGQATQTANWSVAPVVGASILASLFLSRPALFIITAGLIISYLVGVSADLPEHWVNALGNVGAIAAFTWAASLVGVRLIQESRSADAAAQRAADEEQERVRVEARFAERTRQYRRLHDTVLSTLEGIARGGLDYVAVGVRQRCASDANLVRSLSAAVDHVSDLSPLPVVLAQAMRDVQSFGLEIHAHSDRIPHAIPNEVVDAAAGAVREALNNVWKHARVDEAWVTTRGEVDGGILIRIVDNGVGFDPEKVGASGGLDGSIRRRWAEVGGVTHLDSGPTGTMVELIWSP